MGMLGVECAVAEALNCLEIAQLCHVFVLNELYLLYFVRCAEAVKEVHERNARLDRAQMSYESEVHNFLYGSGSEHGKTRLTCAHNVRMIAENRKRMSGKSTCRYMENAGKKLACDFVHVRDHKEKSL